MLRSPDLNQKIHEPSLKSDLNQMIHAPKVRSVSNDYAKLRSKFAKST